MDGFSGPYSLQMRENTDQKNTYEKSLKKNDQLNWLWFLLPFGTLKELVSVYCLMYNSGRDKGHGVREWSEN